VRKLGVPQREELAMGAIAPGGVRVLVHDVVDEMHLAPEVIDAVTAAERIELTRRDREYRGDRAFPPLRGCTVILVDDGVATGASMRAAIQAVRALRPLMIVAAAPVMSTEAREVLRDAADAVEVLVVPELFYSVGTWYDDFSPTSDQEVRVLLAIAAGVL
jgi:putative phosphoribosyl transferase